MHITRMVAAGVVLAASATFTVGCRNSSDDFKGTVDSNADITGPAWSDPLGPAHWCQGMLDTWNTEFEACGSVIGT